MLAMLVTAFAPRAAVADDNACATLAGATQSGALQGFALRAGEPVDLIKGAQKIHGRLLVFGDGSVYRAYWQPDNSAEKYVLANAGADTVRLVSTPPQGTPAPNGQPGTPMAPQRVLSCPTL
ncbi:hypothetical protein LJ656_25615 [Paraburkholderia sp. MMS20-SJTR3]|uniref:Uncharacterized protein n=2 Tax=Paraburkholderia sejongensis TaxID=2886946 RepID=A0ABS8K239_9BURK|nr:hypothetical protein [Paraburkholderia sp. MMS20-SJTR3]MCC8395968.1 hypothetical protein [Paraburkholderia sp. MMS20-SJTR3]